MNRTIKKIIQTFLLSFSGFYLAYLVLISFMFILGSQATHYIDLPGAITLGIITPLIYAVFSTIVLFVFSFLDKKILNNWFVFGFGVYCFILGSVNKQSSIWFLMFLVLVSLLMVVFFMNIKKWKTKFQSNNKLR